MKKTTLILSMLTLLSAPVMVSAGEVSATTTTVSRSLADLQDYVGTYKLKDLPIDKIVVTEQAGKLHYVAGEYEGDFVEVSGKADTYSANNGEATVTFVRNTEGKVASLKLQIPDGTFEGTKEMASAAALTDYVGKYKMSGMDFEFVQLSLKDGQIHFDAGDNKGVFIPVPNQADTFDASGQAVVKFERDAQGKITKIIVDAQGQTFSGVPMAQ
ncbi:DUF3471 domain-containing protein [Telluribacter sp.]|jgi:hypothetical protein|uniref:DUF3471 domain-containing protein n=1 Tax=Telluribacter sp. TaxID=1978767 RepID=UPI002E0FF701|nr:DUF3471 domain-containing protein [Telluribacter sp.]